MSNLNGQIFAHLQPTNRCVADEIDTPEIIIDLDVVENNILRAQKLISERGMVARPHIKTHKIPTFARAQLKAGAIGITCQKLSEAEVMADAGCSDILISYNIVGDKKLARLRELAARVKLTVVADHVKIVQGLDRAMTNGASLGVSVEFNTGMGRAGVDSPSNALSVARAICNAKNLNFTGLMAYPAAGSGNRTLDVLSKTALFLDENGIHCDVVSTGGTPDLFRLGAVPSHVNEYRAGSYIYNDRSLIVAGAADVKDCALRIATTVISRQGSRAMIDAGSKALSSDLFGLEGFGMVIGRPEITIEGLSEEHGHLKLTSAETPLAIGEVLHIVPNHACVVSNLFDEIVVHRGLKFVCRLPVAARGCVK